MKTKFVHFPANAEPQTLSLIQVDMAYMRDLLQCEDVAVQRLDNHNKTLCVLYDAKNTAAPRVGSIFTFPLHGPAVVCCMTDDETFTHMNDDLELRVMANWHPLEDSIHRWN